jgi:hypothetical protein
MSILGSRQYKIKKCQAKKMTHVFRRQDNNNVQLNHWKIWAYAARYRKARTMMIIRADNWFWIYFNLGENVRVEITIYGRVNYTIHTVLAGHVHTVLTVNTPSIFISSIFAIIEYRNSILIQDQLIDSWIFITISPE